MATTKSIDGSQVARPHSYGLLLLTAIYACNFVDRQIVTVLAVPIRDAFSLSNFQVGLLGGLSFALFYSLLGLPLAAIADRGDRVRLLALACGLWSLTTAACGAVGNYAQLFLARMLVGVGEAACVPASHSLICDLYGPAERPKALAIFALGIPLGTLIGLAIGGMVADAAGWRASFLIAGAPGLILALALILFVRDPVRPGPIVRPGPLGLAPALKPLLANPVFRHLAAGASIASMGGYGLIAFLGLYFSSRFNLSLAQIGLGLGLAIGFGGAIGVYAGGLLSIRSAATRWGALTPAAAGLCMASLALFSALAAPNAPAAFAAFFMVAAFNAFWYGPVFAGVQSAATEKNRATAAATLNLVVNLIGLGLGPPALGLIADVTGGVEGLRAAIVGAAIFNLWAAAHFISAGAASRTGNIKGQQTTEAI